MQRPRNNIRIQTLYRNDRPTGTLQAPAGTQTGVDRRANSEVETRQRFELRPLVITFQIYVPQFKRFID